MANTPNYEQIAGQIRAFLLERYLFGFDEKALTDDISFLEHGILDSLGVLELIDFIDSTFGIAVADEEILPENLDSVGAVSRYILGKSSV